MEKRTTEIVIKEIVTGLSSFELFSLFRDRKHCFFLDSGMDPQKLGRYSFIGFDPELTLTAKAGVDAFAELKALLEEYQLDYAGELPFIGGAVGYFGYELRHQVERLPKEAHDDVQIPDSFFGIYDGAIVVDHLLGKVHLASPGFFGDPEKWVCRGGKGHYCSGRDAFSGSDLGIGQRSQTEAHCEHDKGLLFGGDCAHQGVHPFRRHLSGQHDPTLPMPDGSIALRAVHALAQHQSRLPSPRTSTSAWGSC